jgi:transposase-like protein
MIAPIRKASKRERAPSWHAGFLAMLPKIKRYAEYAFRHWSAEAREEAVQETLANAMVAYVRLAKRGKLDMAHPTVLARYAVGQIRDGRRVGIKRNVRDVMSPHARRKKGFILESLDRFDRVEGEWLEAVVEDDRTPIADQVAFRIDFPKWLGLLRKRDRLIAEALATGHSTSEVAAQFRLSRGRISQMRREYFESWKAFHQDDDNPVSGDADPA